MNVKFKNILKNGFVILFVLMAISLFISGCGAKRIYINSNSPFYNISVSSFGKYDISGKTYYIESGMSGISAADLEFKEYAGFVSKSLFNLGAIETVDKKNADICILMSYGSADESYNEIVPVPVWGQTGFSSITTTSYSAGTFNGSATRFGNTVYGSSQGEVVTKTNTSLTPSYGITGYVSESHRVSKFCHVLNLYSYDNKRTSEPEMLWKTNLKTYSNTDEIRKVIPYMAFIAWLNIGYTGGMNNKFGILENDYFFHMWNQGLLKQSGVFPFPKVAQTNVSSNLSVILMQRVSEGTIVVLRKSGCIGWYRINPNIYIEYGSQKYFIKKVEGYTLGEKIYNECGVRYFQLFFPAIPSDAKSINIKEDVENGWEWKGIELP